jgi:hypothetical protein
MNLLGIQELGYFWLIWFAVEAVVRVFFFVGVLLDASRMKRLAGATFLAPGPVWALAVLVGGIIPVLVYWLVHHSSLRSQKPPWVSQE